MAALGIREGFEKIAKLDQEIREKEATLYRLKHKREMILQEVIDAYWEKRGGKKRSKKITEGPF